jgi:hypothetical protein
VNSTRLSFGRFSAPRTTAAASCGRGLLVVIVETKHGSKFQLVFLKDDGNDFKLSLESFNLFQITRRQFGHVEPFLNFTKEFDNPERQKERE